MSTLYYIAAMLTLLQFEHFHSPSTELESFVFGKGSEHGRNGCVNSSFGRGAVVALDADYI